MRKEVEGVGAFFKEGFAVARELCALCPDREKGKGIW